MESHLNLFYIMFICLFCDTPQAYIHPIHPTIHRLSNKSPQSALLLKQTSRVATDVNKPFLTVIIPAYNEQDRVLPTLDKYQRLLEHQFWRSQILVVDDGSTDRTVAIVSALCPGGARSRESTCVIECFSLHENQGKGFALAAAVEKVAASSDSSSEGLILTVDADGSADLSVCLEEMYLSLCNVVQQSARIHNNERKSWDHLAMVCGYRVYNNDDNSNTLMRRIFHWGFRAAVRVIFLGTALVKIRDTQCCCKLMTVAAAKKLYTNLHLQRWSHDIEVLYRAVLLGIDLQQLPVQWKDCAGSRLVEDGIYRVALSMLWDVALCRVAYRTERWQVY